MLSFVFFNLNLTESVLKTKGGELATQADIKAIIQNWLKGAYDRGGGRHQRRLSCKPKVPPTEANEDNGSK